MKKKCLLLICLGIWACEDIFEKDIRHKQVDVLAPPSGLETTRTTLTFVWNPLKGASDYHLIVVSPAFKWIESYLLDTVVETCRFTLDLPEGEYEWTVRGLNSAYESRDTISFFRVISPEEGGTEP